VGNRGQFFDLLRRIVILRNEKDRKNGPISYRRTTAWMQELERRRMPKPSIITLSPTDSGINYNPSISCVR